MEKKSLQVGDRAPAFTVPVTPDGDDLSLADLKGKPVVLYFYPRDNTPGCTIENIDFTSLLSKFRRLGIQLYGISRDSCKTHLNFSTKQGLAVPLLADVGEKVCNLYGVMRDKNMYGKKVRGIERSTFVIDAKGRIVEIWRKVKVDGHAEEVLNRCRELFPKS